MIIMIVNMFFKIRAQKRAIAPQTVNPDRSVGRNKRMHNQMFILMLSSVGIFFVTTLPLTIDDVVSSYTISDIAGIERLLVTRTIINWVQSLNCAVSFFFFVIINMINHRLIFMSIVLLLLYFEKNSFN